MQRQSSEPMGQRDRWWALLHRAYPKRPAGGRRQPGTTDRDEGPGPRRQPGRATMDADGRRRAQQPRTPVGGELNAAGVCGRESRRAEEREGSAADQAG